MKEVTTHLNEEGNDDYCEYFRRRRENGYREIQCDHKYRSATMLQRHIEREHKINPLEEITIPLQVQEEDGSDHREHEEADMRNMRQRFRFKCDDCGFTTTSDYVWKHIQNSLIS